MAYTTVAAVSGQYPSFTRGGANQKPTDDQIGVYIADAEGEVNAVLFRRFNEAIAEATNGSFDLWIGNLPTGAVNVLEKIARYGAGAQLGIALATLGSKSAKELATDFQARYQQLLYALDSRNEQGEPLSSGMYDHFFDSQARVETPRPGIGISTGADRDPNDVQPFHLNEVI